jgi:hypothetical protein
VAESLRAKFRIELTDSLKEELELVPENVLDTLLSSPVAPSLFSAWVCKSFLPCIDRELMRWSNISVSFKLFLLASLEDAGVVSRGVQLELLKSFIVQFYACESISMFGGWKWFL